MFINFVQIKKEVVVATVIIEKHWGRKNDDEHGEIYETEVVEFKCSSCQCVGHIDSGRDDSDTGKVGFNKLFEEI